MSSYTTATTEHDSGQVAELSQAQRRDLHVSRETLFPVLTELRRAMSDLDAAASIAGSKVSDDDLYRITGKLFSVADACIVAARSVRTVAAEVTVGKSIEA